MEVNGLDEDQAGPVSTGFPLKSENKQYHGSCESVYMEKTLPIQSCMFTYMANHAVQECI